jgi:hypothetical protein
VAYYKVIYPGNRVEGTTKTTKNLSQDSRSPARDLNPGPPEYEARVSPTRPRRSVYFSGLSPSCRSAPRKATWLTRTLIRPLASEVKVQPYLHTTKSVRRSLFLTSQSNKFQNAPLLLYFASTNGRAPLLYYTPEIYFLSVK